MEMDSKSNITKGSKTEPLVKRMTLGARLHKQLVRKCHLYALFTKLSDTPSTLEKLFQLFHYVHFPNEYGALTEYKHFIKTHGGSPHRQSLFKFQENE